MAQNFLTNTHLSATWCSVAFRVVFGVLLFKCCQLLMAVQNQKKCLALQSANNILCIAMALLLKNVDVDFGIVITVIVLLLIIKS